MSMKQAARNVYRGGDPGSAVNMPVVDRVTELYDNVRHTRPTVAALLADTRISTTVGATAYAAVGDWVQAESYLYQVADPDSVDAIDGDETGYHLITAGGIKLRFVPGPDMIWHPRAFGATGNGDTSGDGDDATLYRMLRIAPNGAKIRNSRDGDVYVVTTPRVFTDRYFDLGLSLKAGRATSWCFWHFTASSDETPLPKFKMTGCVLDGNKSEQWYVPAPFVTNIDPETGEAYGKYYQDPVINYHRSAPSTLFPTDTHDQDAVDAYNVSGNRGFISVDRVRHFRGKDIEYRDICRNGLVVSRISGSAKTRGSIGDGQVMMNYQEQAAYYGGADGAYEASYEKFMDFNDEGDATAGQKRVIKIEQEADFGECAYALFVRINNPKPRQPRFHVKCNTSVKHASRDPIWIEPAEHVDLTVDLTGPYSPDHPFRNDVGGIFLSNSIKSGRITGFIRNGQVNGNEGQGQLNVVCDKLNVIHTARSGAYGIQNVSEAVGCYVWCVNGSAGIWASKIRGSLVEDAGRACNVFSLLSGFQAGTRTRYFEHSQAFTPAPGTTALVCTDAVNPLVVEAQTRVIRRVPSIDNGTPWQCGPTERTISGSGAGMTITLEQATQAGEEVTVYWVELIETTATAGTTGYNTITTATPTDDSDFVWDTYSVEVDGVATDDWTVTRDSTNRAVYSVNATSGAEIVIQSYPKAQAHAGNIYIRGYTKLSDVVSFGSPLQIGNGSTDISLADFDLIDCPADQWLQAVYELNTLNAKISARRGATAISRSRRACGRR